jgi:hypothetical protein
VEVGGDGLGVGSREDLAVVVDELPDLVFGVHACDSRDGSK